MPSRLLVVPEAGRRKCIGFKSGVIANLCIGRGNSKHNVRFDKRRASG